MRTCFEVFCRRISTHLPRNASVGDGNTERINLRMSNTQKDDANMLRASPNSPVFQIVPPLIRALLTLPQVALDHDPGNSLLPGLELTADIIADNRLVLVVFGRVGVRGVDHERGVGVFSARGDVGEVFLDVIRPARRRQDSGRSAWVRTETQDRGRMNCRHTCSWDRRILREG